MGLPRSCSRLPAVAVIVAGGLVVAACGSGSSGGKTSSGSTAATGGARTNTSSGSTATTNGTSSSRSATITYAPAKATVIGKGTDIVVNPAVLLALKQANIAVAAVAPATANTTLHFPVSGGQVARATLAGTVDHAGALTFSHSGKRVTLTNFVIKTKAKHVTATAGGRPMPIFDLNLASSHRGHGPHGTVVESNIKLTVTSQAAAALNNGLGVGAFKAGNNFGIATLTLAYARGHR
jgi:hypothetical protein